MKLGVGVAVPNQQHRSGGGGLSIPTSGPPVNLAIPTISGTPEQFQTLTCDPGVWGGAPTLVYTYQWYRETTIIADATSAVYHPTYLDVDFRLKCRVTVTNGSGSEYVDTAYTIPIALVQVALPSIASMIFAFEPGDPTSNELTLDQTFAPSDVNVAGNKIALSGLLFPAFVPTSEDYKGTPVYFSSTGTLPGGLVANTPYYLSEESGGYGVYPEQRTNDYLNMPTAVAIETLMPAQNYLELTNRITITNQGTGVHRMYTNPIIDTIYDRLGTGCTIQNRTPGDRHSGMQVIIDGNGRHIVSRELARAAKADEGGTYNLYGPSPVQGGINKGVARSYSSNIRVAWATHVVRLVLPQNKNVRKNNFAPSMVNTTTGVFTYTSINGRFVTGNMVKMRTGGAGNAIPGGFTAGTPYYVRITSGGAFTLHPTLADANANTNIIIPSNAGTGKFVIYAPQRVGDFHRQIFFQEWLEPNGGANTLTPYVKNSGPSTGGILSASAWSVSGTTNGDILGLKNFGNGRRVYLWFAEEAVRPVCTDTGLALADGYYYVTKYTGGNDYGRLHRTLQDAEDCIGIATNLCDDAKRIKFDGSAVVGEALINWADNVVPWVPNAEWDSNNTWPYSPHTEDTPLDYTYFLPNDGNVHAFTFLVDNDHPDYPLGFYKLYIDGVLQHTWELPDSVKGPSDITYGSGQPAWTWLNSAALHVPFVGDIYATYMGTTLNEVTDAEIRELHEYTFAKFNVVEGLPVPLAPTNTTLPAISGTLTTGQDITCSDGVWSEYPVGAKTFQWKRNGVNIPLATSSVYRLIAPDADQLISCDVTSTNGSGTATVNTGDVGPIVGVPAAPSVATANSISGNLNEGFILTLTRAIWNGYPDPTVSIQWKADGVDISGATSTTLDTTGLSGKIITCVENATNASGGPIPCLSNSLGPIIAAPSYEAEASTLFARMSPAPDAALKFDVNTLIKALKDAGVWTKLDMLQVYAVPVAQYALLDWKTSSRTASLVTLGSGPIFTANRGYKGTLATAEYIDTGYNTVTFAGNFSQNSAHIGVFPVADATDTTSAGAADLGVTRAYMITRTNSGTNQGEMNATASLYTETGLSTAVQHYCWSRAASANFQTYRNGTQISASFSQTSVTPTNANMRALTREGGTSYSTRTLGIVHTGGALTQQNVTDMYAAFRTYLVARGVTGI